MLIECEDLGSMIVLSFLQRRLDSSVAPDFREAAIECIRSDCSVYVLDLEKLTFVDSSGIGAVVGVLKHIGRDRRLELCGMNPMVRKVFRMTRLDQVFSIRKDRQACLEFYKNPIKAVS